MNIRINELFFGYTCEYFNVYLKKQCSRSYHTIESYRDALTVFRKFITDYKAWSIKKFLIKECTKELIMEYIQWMKDEGKKPTTVNHHVSVIKGYLWFVADKNITYQNIAISVGHVPKIRTPKKERPILDDKVLEAMFKAPKNNKIGLRNKVIMIMLYETAVRVGELIKMKKEDLFLNRKEPYIFIHGKGDKERIIGISLLVVEHLKTYLNVFHKNNECDYVFYTIIKGHSQHISESTIETFIQKYADQLRETNLEIPEHVHPHMFRRSRASHLYQDNIPIELVARVLGHSSIETTRDYYAKPSLEQMRKIIENENDKNTEPEWEDDDEILKMFDIR